MVNVVVPVVAEPVAFEAFHVPLSMMKSYVVVGVFGVVGVLSGLVGVFGVGVGVLSGLVGVLGVTSWLCVVLLLLMGELLLPPQPELRNVKTSNAITSQHKFLRVI